MNGKMCFIDKGRRGVFFFFGAIVEILNYSFFDENAVFFFKGYLKIFLANKNESIYVFMHRGNIFLISL